MNIQSGFKLKQIKIKIDTQNLSKISSINTPVFQFPPRINFQTPCYFQQRKIMHAVASPNHHSTAMSAHPTRCLTENVHSVLVTNTSVGDE
jgi:hypothetical protein